MSRTLAWERLGNRFLTNVEGPTMRWDLDVSQHNVRAAECAGILISWPKVENVTRPITQIASNSKQLMKIFSSNGIILGQISLDFGNIVDACVLSDETVIAISDSGIARHFIDFGLNFTQIQLPKDVIQIKEHGNGYFVRFDNNSADESDRSTSLGIVSRCTASEPSFRTMASAISSFRIIEWELVPADEDSGRPLRHLFVDDQGKLHTFDSELSEKSHQVVFHGAPIGKIRISPNKELLALSDNNTLITLTSDVYQLDYESASVPEHNEIYWVGSTMIAVKNHKDGGEIVVFDVCSSASSTDNNTTIYFEDENVALIEEIDGLRVLGTHNHSILIPISNATLDTFKLGSISPSAILYSCVDLIDSGSPLSEQTVKMLEPSNLHGAVEVCITAALLELEPKVQKRLLRAAAFGKSMLTAYDSTRYLRSLTYLRVGNSLRSMGDKSLFITNAQIEKAKTPILIQRLQNRELWGEAVSLAQFMQVPIEPVYINWACSIIQKEDLASEEQLVEKIQNKLSKLHNYSRSKIALKAFEQGRQELAISLLEREPILSDRVVLLLEMGMTQQALQQAVLSGNPFLIDFVLANLTKQLSLPQMIRIIGGDMIAVDRQKDLIYALSISSGDDTLKCENKLHEYLNQMDLRSQSIKLEFKSVIEEVEPSTKIKTLHALEKKFSSIGKKSLPESKACSEWADLLTIQKQLSESYGLELHDKSAAETLLALLKVPQLAQAQKIKGKLGISERQFMWLRMQALVARREFEELWELSQARKPSINFQSYFNMCFEAGNMEQASRYVHLINGASQEDKIKLYVKCRNYDLARTLAARNSELLSLIP